MSRCYTVGENRGEYPSVTTILGDCVPKGDGLLYWSAGLAVDYIKKAVDEKLEAETVCLVDELPPIFEAARKEWKAAGVEAMDIGSEVHEIIEGHTTAHTVRGNFEASAERRPEVDNAFNAFREWEKENIAEWLESERTVVCEEHGYAGTLDAVARLKSGGVYVIDFKSSKGFYDGYDMQIAAYRYAYGTPVDGMGILRLDKDSGLPEWKDYSKDYDRKLAAFHLLVRYWYTVKVRRLKNNPFVVGK